MWRKERKLEEKPSRWMAFIDVLSKLWGPAAVLIGAVMAQNFQAASTAASLQNQREQANSTLKAGMFRDLIAPITGKDAGNLKPEQERLLVELLALNFNEHFELKPLMLHADAQLRAEHARTGNATSAAGRSSLRSVARRVLQRQVAQITQVGDSAGDAACIYRVEVIMPDEQDARGRPTPSECFQTITMAFNDGRTFRAPPAARDHSLRMIFFEPAAWDDETFRVNLLLDDDARQSGALVKNADFVVTWFDFPFVDNTLLEDGTRFSLVLESVNARERKAVFNLIWFPRNYIAPTDRPSNYGRMRESLGLART